MVVKWAELTALMMVVKSVGVKVYWKAVLRVNDLVWTMAVKQVER